MIEIARTARGRIAVDGQALTRLVRRAAERVEGVESAQVRRGVRIAVEGERAVAVSVAVVARSGVVLPELGRRVQERVAEALRTALEPEIVHVDVAIERLA